MKSRKIKRTVKSPLKSPVKTLLKAPVKSPVKTLPSHLDDVKFNRNDISDNEMKQLSMNLMVASLYGINDLRWICIKYGVKCKTINEFVRNEQKQNDDKDDDKPIVKPVVKRRKFGYLQTRKKKKVNASVNDNIGQYEVEKIVDWAIDTDENIMYLIKWKGWDDEDNTWEREQNVHDCHELLQLFYQNNGKETLKYSFEEFKTFIDKLNLIVSQSYDDICVLLKLTGGTLAKFNFSKYNESIRMLKNKISQYLNLLKNLKICNNKDITKKRDKIRMITSKLLCDKGFGSITEFFKFLNEREQLLSDLKKWENDINEQIEKLDDGPKIKVENYVDFERLPKLNYLKEYLLDPNLTKKPLDTESIYGCKCNNCYDSRVHCCTAVIGYKMTYNKDGYYHNDQDIIFECNSKCRCTIDCPNRAIQRGRKFNLCIFRTENGTRGWGVKTLEVIPKGSFIEKYVGELISLTEADRRDRTYLYDLDSHIDQKDVDYTYVVDSKFYGNVSRYMNHSCGPNMRSAFAWIETYNRFVPKIVLFSYRTIQPNEELTYDYGMSLIDIVDYDSINNTFNKKQFLPKHVNDDSQSADSGVATGDYEGSDSSDDSDSDTDSGKCASEVSTDRVTETGSDTRSESERPKSRVIKYSRPNISEKSQPPKKIECRCGAKTCCGFLYN